MHALLSAHASLHEFRSILVSVLINFVLLEQFERKKRADKVAAVIEAVKTVPNSSRVISSI